MKLVVKVHHKDNRTVVAVCDASLLGTVIEENGVQLDLTSDFFQGDVCEKVQDVGDLLRNADGVNLVGEESVKLGLSEDVIEEDQVKKVDGVPHAQAVVLHED